MNDSHHIRERKAPDAGVGAALALTIERIVAMVVLLIPLLVVATHRSADPWLWRVSGKLTGLLLFAFLGYVAVVLSYRIKVPQVVAVARRVVVVAVASILAAGVIAEGLLVIIDPFPFRPIAAIGRHKFDPDVGHVFKPNYEQVLGTREWRQPWRSNAQGVRADRDYREPPDSVARVLILGDSFSLGDQVSVDSAFPGVLQKRFDGAFGPGRVEVVNAGHPSYGTYHEATYLQKYGAQFDPDVIVLAMTPNDWIENENPLWVIARDGALVRRGTTPGQIAQWIDLNQWYSLSGYVLRSRVKARLDRVAARRDPGTGDKPYAHRAIYLTNPDERVRQQDSLVYYHIGSIRAEADRLDASLVIILIPFGEQLVPYSLGYDPRAPGQRVAAYAAEHGIPFLDLLEAFRTHPTPSNLYWVEDYHCTALGYGVIGDALFDMLDGLSLPRLQQ